MKLKNPPKGYKNFLGTHTVQMVPKYIWIVVVLETKKVVPGCMRQEASYTGTVVWEFAWADSALVVLDEWLFYRGGCLNSFDSGSLIEVNVNNLDKI